MTTFEELAAGLSAENLSFLCRLHPIVGRELLVTGNIYGLVRAELVRVGPPLVRQGGSSDGGFRYSYKLTARGARFLEWLRSQGSGRAHAGS